MAQPELSVLIVSWNRHGALAECLRAVRTLLPEAQVVVVDNGSDPPLPHYPGTLTLRSETNLGFAGGNNLGWPRCTGRCVLLLNNDVLLRDRATVDALMAWMDAHPRCAAAQAKLVLPDGTLDACGERLTGCGMLCHRGYRRPDSPAMRVPARVYAGKGACLLLRREAAERAGQPLFRPEYFCYYEDVDLCHRLWLAGWEVWFVPGVPALHDEGSSARLLPPRDLWRQYLSNMLTTALDLWGPRFWLTRGPGFCLMLLLGACLKGVLPRVRGVPRMRFERRRSERDLLALVTQRVPLRYYWRIARGRPSAPED